MTITSQYTTSTALVGTIHHNLSDRHRKRCGRQAKDGITCRHNTPQLPHLWCLSQICLHLSCIAMCMLQTYCSRLHWIHYKCLHVAIHCTSYMTDVWQYFAFYYIHHSCAHISVTLQHTLRHTLQHTLRHTLQHTLQHTSDSMSTRTPSLPSSDPLPPSHLVAGASDEWAAV